MVSGASLDCISRAGTLTTDWLYRLIGKVLSESISLCHEGGTFHFSLHFSAIFSHTVATLP